MTTGNIFGGGLANPGFNTETFNAAESEFTFDVLDFDLTQTAQDSFSDGERIGSLLTQTYEVTNTGNEEVDFELVRYLDGDLLFDGSITDGGGRIFRDGEEILLKLILRENLPNQILLLVSLTRVEIQLFLFDMKLILFQGWVIELLLVMS